MKKVKPATMLSNRKIARIIYHSSKALVRTEEGKRLQPYVDSGVCTQVEMDALTERYDFWSRGLFIKNNLPRKAKKRFKKRCAIMHNLYLFVIAGIDVEPQVCSATD